MPGQRLTQLMLEALYFSGGASLANRSFRGQGSILMLHRVEKQPRRAFSPNAHLSVTPEFLESVLQMLSSSIYQFSSLDEVARRLGGVSNTPKPARPFLAITLDDGYKDNLEFAVPLFRKYNVPYTIYVAPGLVDGRATLWWEDLENIIASRNRLDIDMPGGRAEYTIETPDQKKKTFDHLLNYLAFEVSETDQRQIIHDLSWLYNWNSEAHRANSIMTWKELKMLSEDPLCTLGAHTIGHYAVGRLNAEDALYEMKESKRLIELEIDKPVTHFAYPYGYPAAASKRDFELAERVGFSTAVTTRHGVCYEAHQHHMMALPRISLNGNFQKLRYVRTLLSGATARLANKGAKLNID